MPDTELLTGKKLSKTIYTAERSRQAIGGGVFKLYCKVVESMLI